MKFVLRITDETFVDGEIELGLFNFNEFDVVKGIRGRAKVGDDFYINLDTKNKVPDVVRYFVEWNGSEFSFREPKEELKIHLEKIENDKYDSVSWQDYKFRESVPSIDWESEPIKNIVLILESPHIKEFDKIDEPIAPAIGSTGKKIHSKLPKIFNEFGIDQKNFNLIICNPIQYQTSLGNAMNGMGIYSSMRDKVWKRLFNESKEKGFKKRLLSYAPSYIINACTKKLKDTVGNFVKDEIYEQSTEGNITYLEINHPSSSKFDELKNEILIRVR